MFDSGLVELQEAIPAGSNIRLTFDAESIGQTSGYIFGLDDVLFRVMAPGDIDGNGEVDSNDLFNIPATGKFNRPELGPATWGEGDFTGDTLVNSADLFAMLGAGKFNQGPYSSSPPATDVSISLLAAIDTNNGSSFDDSGRLAWSREGSYLATYGSINGRRASHRPNSAPLARSANANSFTIDDSDNVRRATSRLRHFGRAESLIRAASERANAVDHTMQTLGRSTQTGKEKWDLNVAAHDLSDVLLEALAAGLL